MKKQNCQNSNDTRVVITGMGAVTPIGIDLNDFWSNAVKGTNGISHIQAFDCEGFSSQIAAEVRELDIESHIARGEMKKMDRFSQFAIIASREAVKNSGLSIDHSNSDRVGVFVGSGVGGLHSIETEHEKLKSRGPRRVSPFLVPKMIINLASGNVSIDLGARGPNCSMVTACASSLHCIGEAYWMIRRGDADAMIAGGAEAGVTPLCLAAFAAMRALSTRNDEPETASRPFDRYRDGFVIGEGAGIVVLESLESAMKRNAEILAEIKGYGLSGDAHHISSPPESGEGAARSMSIALERALLDPAEIDLISAHGTSTPLNDKVETRAIKKVFGPHAKNLHINSTKSMIGHLLGAAGGVELITCVQSIRNNVIHPTINLQNPDPECDLNYTPHSSVQKNITNVACNSFGFGGTNACMIVGQFDN